jgi:hypothetical protein
MKSSEHWENAIGGLFFTLFISVLFYLIDCLIALGRHPGMSFIEGGIHTRSFGITLIVAISGFVYTISEFAKNIKNRQERKR